MEHLDFTFPLTYTGLVPTAMTGQMTDADRKFVLSRMRYYDKHPHKSERFMDVFPIFTSPRATELVISDFLAYIQSKYDVSKEVGVVVGPEAEGFLLGPLVATRLGIPFVPARKQGKLPGDVLREHYNKWASKDVLEIQAHAFDELDSSKGAIIVDDSLASGGSAGGVKRLCERAGMKVLCGCFIFDADMEGHRKTQKEHLGDLDFHAILSVSEETLEGMELYDGKKGENGEYVGDMADAAPGEQH